MTTKELEQEQLRLSRKLHKAVWKADKEFGLFKPGEKVMACLSGGKDSYTMLDVLLHMGKAIGFDVIAVNLDQKQPGFPEDVLPNYLESLGVEYHVIEKDTYSVVMEKLPEGKTMCSLCTRLRRGTLYEFAREKGITRIALGHHRDDIVETLLLNLLFAGKLEAMPAKYRTNDNNHLVIRPLAFCKEKDIEEYAKLRQFPIIPCNLCGSQDGLQRQNIKQLLKKWEESYPNRTEIIFNAVQNVSPSHLMDRELFEFLDI